MSLPSAAAMIDARMNIREFKVSVHLVRPLRPNRLHFYAARRLGIEDPDFFAEFTVWQHSPSCEQQVRVMIAVGAALARTMNR